MDQELIKKIDNLEKKIDESAKQLKRLRLYFLWTLIISASVIILPLIGLMFVIPQFLDSYQSLGL
ncbi:hypothetical protein KKA27_00890 [Patescibacteria group bacterium]|nr:hypothetical protein [Patescibacteria group bacterium]MBU2633138.1 hypothetical protein [Patescibacteria group bacterium]